MASDELIRLTAREAVSLLKSGAVSPLELIDAALDRIEATDGAINAMPTLCPERARGHAMRLAAGMNVPADPGPGWLAGLPIAIKELDDLAGVRTTYGSPIFADNVPTRSDIMVEGLEANGAIAIGMSNSPEFGAGGNTFNEVHGETRNPWNAALNAAGSSGGSAAALATGQVWLATGSDLGGSLRTPASFCSVVGFRPSPGRVAHGPSELKFGPLSIHGPMARNVGDAALMLDAMAGWHIEDPLSLPPPAQPFQMAADWREAPKRVAFSEDLGITPVDPEVRRLCREAAWKLETAGARVEDAHPDFEGVFEAFQVLRALSFATSMKPLYDNHRHLLKPDIVWNIELGFTLTPEQIGQALLRQSRLYADMVAFFETYDVLIAPAACTPPLPIEIRWLRSLEGVQWDNYVEWLRIVSVITMSTCPVIALPAAFTADGRPVGIQMVGRPRGDWSLLSAAASFEEIAGVAGLTPIDPRP
ncbi:MAG: amidase family protein [Dongiaceae bacterium]